MVVTLVNRIQDESVDIAADATPGEATYQVPAGARLVTVTQVKDRALLHFRDPQGVDSIVILDPETGRMSHRLQFTPVE